MTRKIRFYTNIEEMPIAIFKNIEVPQVSTTVRLFEINYKVVDVLYWYPKPEDAEDGTDELILIDVYIEKEEDNIDYIR